MRHHTAGWVENKNLNWQDVVFRALSYIRFSLTFPTFDFSHQGFIRSLHFHTSVLPVICKYAIVTIMSKFSFYHDIVKSLLLQ